MAALTQLVAKSFGSVFGLTTVTLTELRDGILLYYLFEKRIVLGRVRIDKGSETGDMAIMHTFLRSGHGDLEDLSEKVIFRKSTGNQLKDGGGSYMIVLKNTLKATYVSTRRRSL